MGTESGVEVCVFIGGIGTLPAKGVGDAEGNGVLPAFG